MHRSSTHIRSPHGGTTAAVAAARPDGAVVTAHVGDSRVVVARPPAKKRAKVKVLHTTRDKDVEERLLRVKQELAKAQSQHQLDLKARTAELETHHRVREAQQEKRHADDRQQLMDSFQRELAKIGDEHRRAERELER
eukprot:gene26855-41757_t